MACTNVILAQCLVVLPHREIIMAAATATVAGREYTRTASAERSESAPVMVFSKPPRRKATIMTPTPKKISAAGALDRSALLGTLPSAKLKDR